MASDVFYSISPFGTGDIKTGSPNLTIAGGVATLTVAQTGNIGVGCRITYDTTSIAYISGVISSTVFSVVTAVGGTPGAEASPVVVNSIAHEYASLSAFEAGFVDATHINNVDLTAADVVAHACCYYDHDDGTKDTTDVTVNWAGTTDATRYLKIFTPTGGTESIVSQRHIGVFDATKYVLSTASVAATMLLINESFVRLEGIQIEATGTSQKVIDYRGTGEFYCDKIIVNGDGATTPTYGIFFDVCGAGSVIYIWNNIVYSIGTGIFWSFGNAISGAVYNNTVIDCITNEININGTGVNNSLYIKNNLAQGLGGGGNYVLGGQDGTATNLSEDATSPDAAFRSKSVTFLDETGNDFRLSPDDTGAINNGTDLTTDADGVLSFPDDIVENTRSGEHGTGLWDIGAHRSYYRTKDIQPLLARMVLHNRVIIEGDYFILKDNSFVRGTTYKYNIRNNVATLE